MTVLIVTHTQDNDSITMVMNAIEAQGGKAFRFDTDRFPTEVQLDVYYGDSERVILTDGEQKLDLSEVSSVWYRRINHGGKIPETMDKQFRDASVQETHWTAQGTIVSIKGLFLNTFTSLQLSKNKQIQLRVAREVGLLTPRTLTTNNPQAVKQFAQECKQGMITKMIASFAIYNEQGREQVVFTNPVKDEDLENLEGLRFCPMTFQEKVPKALELRTTIVGHRVFTAAVDSQRLEGSAHDWRKEGRALIDSWQPYELPEDVEKKLLKLMAYFGLSYGAIDIIVTPDGQYVFLEVNPAGEFFWLEKFAPHFPISEAIAEFLLTNK